jgi:hypothetical protein
MDLKIGASTEYYKIDSLSPDIKIDEHVAELIKVVVSSFTRLIPLWSGSEYQ